MMRRVLLLVLSSGLLYACGDDVDQAMSEGGDTDSGGAASNTESRGDGVTLDGGQNDGGDATDSAADDQGDDAAGDDDDGLDGSTSGDDGADGATSGDGGDGTATAGDGDDGTATAGGGDGGTATAGDGDDGDDDGGANVDDGGDDDGGDDEGDGGNDDDDGGDDKGDGNDDDGGDDKDDGGGGDDGGDDGDDCEDEGGDDDGGGNLCEMHETPLVAGQNIDAGWVVVEFVDDELILGIETWSPWMLELLHVYAGTGPIPANNGAYIPGLFPYHWTFDPAVSETSVAIPIAELGATCGDPLKIAVHAEVAGDECGEETAWAEGPFSDVWSWGMAFEVPLCCPG